MKNSIPWYRNYPALREEVDNLRNTFIARSESLGLDPIRVIYDFGKEIVPFLVEESDWEKDHLPVDFEDQDNAKRNLLSLPNVENSHLHMNNIVEEHLLEVVRLKKENASNKQIAAYNLSKAIEALWFVRMDCVGRLLESSTEIKGDDKGLYPRDVNKIPPDQLKDLLSSFQKQLTRLNDMPLKKSSLMNVAYIQFLYQLVFMGIESYEDLGAFNRVSSDSKFTSLFFFSPSDITTKMEVLIKDFPVLLNEIGEDSIQSAARISFRFIKIHPYKNGNGRISKTPHKSHSAK